MQYEQERRRLTRRRTRTAASLAAGIIPFYSVADFLLYPDQFAALVRVRVFAVLLCLTALVLTRRPLGHRFPYLVAEILCLGLALATGGIPVLWLGYSMPYYVVFILVIFGVALFMPWPPSIAAVLSLVLMALYVGASALHGPITNWTAFACNASFIGATIGIALVSMDAGEELRQREFRTRFALEEAYSNKAQLATDLADKTAKLETLNHEMEDLLYVASHDLRAPLINVQGFSRELQLALDQLRGHNGKSPETNAALTDVDESLQFIITSVARMDALIASLLNVSRIVTRTNPTEQVDLDALLHKLHESFHYQLTAKEISMHYDPLPVVVGDAVRLGQLFSNLIDNAIKYMNHSPERRIHVGVSEEHAERRFFVRDTGPGIPIGQQEEIFRLFRRLANGDCPGEGIGLTMARKIVEKHGGRIWVESARGAGTTFWFTLSTNGPAPTFEIGGTA